MEVIVHFRIISVSAMLALVIASSFAAESDRQGAKINQLSWLAGCWEWSAGARLGEEHWMEPRGGSMLGMSRTVRKDSTTEYEFLRIEQREGRLHYIAMPSGQAGATFSSIEVTARTVVFANPKHDFPQRIIYKSRGDSLFARVEGMRNGSVRGVDFPMRRAACARRRAPP